MKAKADYWAFSSGLLRYKPGVTLIDIGCNVLIFGHGTALSFFARQVLNHLDPAIQGQAMKQVVGALAAILAVSVARVAVIMACAALDAARAYYYQNRTRLALMRRILARSDVGAVAGASGGLFEVLDDDVPATTFPAELLTEVTGYLICTLGTLAILFAIRWQIALLVFLPLSAAIYGVQRLSGKMQARRRLSREAHDDVSTFLGDVVDSVLTIKAAGAEADVLAAYARRNARRRDVVLKDAAFGAAVNALLAGSAHVGTAVLMAAFAGMMAGDFKAGDFSIFVASLFVLADSVNRITELFTEYRKGQVSFDRIMEAAGGGPPLPVDTGLTLLRPDGYAAPAQGAPPPAGALVASALCYAYDNEGGVRDVSLTVRPGEVVAVAGGVGSGKSTLLHLLAGAIAPDRGGVARADGRPIARTPPSMGYAPQRPRFFSTDVADNLAMGRAIDRQALAAALGRAQLADLNPDTPLSKRGASLSGGQRQRLALARLYAHRCQVNLIDDQLSALDAATQKAVLENLVRYAREERRAVVVATNCRAALEAADAVLVMKDGRTRAFGRFDELASDEYLQSIST